ncbi:transglutaminase domain-containing protein [Cryobacterium sp. SO1]|uniref:transglutaminase domain-containing protein n=1 Tax=Cryobacterium sp. SO1 TaxID=1897061 RepID=UPI002108C0D6|nr:transglutaminaseTgpA domain-containing protein [Cryobacterium sp. SO1]
MSGRFVLGNTVAVLAATGVAAAALWPVYQTGAFVLLVVVAAVVGCGIAILGAWRRWPAWLVGVCTIAGYLLIGVPLAVPGRALYGFLPSLTGLAELVPATALGWKQLVTIVLPVGSYQALLVPALILVLLSTVIGLSVALRCRAAEAALLGPVLLFVAGIALGPSQARTPTLLGLALFTLLVIWLLWLNLERRRGRLLVAPTSARMPAADRRMGAARAVVVAALALTVAILAGTVAAVALPPTASRDVLRTRVQAPFDARAYPSPLAAFRNYLQPDRADVVLFDVEGLPAGGRIRLATLDDYNGVVYAVGSADAAAAGPDSGTFTRLPYRLDQSAVRGDEVTLTVSIREYDGVWVPGIGALERIEFTGDGAAARRESFVYNDLGGTAAVLTGLENGDSYTSTAVVPAPAGDLADAVPGPAVLPAVTVLPDGLADTLAGVVRPGDSAGQNLQNMLDFLTSTGYVSHGTAGEPVSRSGHGADRLDELLDDQPMLGDAEQYAVTAALMARQLGFPARVVMGFLPAADNGAARVTGADVSAWIEVQTQADGWVALDPNPPVRDIPVSQPDDPAPIARPQTVLPPPAPETAEQPEPSQPESQTVDPPAAADPFWATVRLVVTITAWSLLGLGLLAAPFLAIVAAKWRRRRRRRLAARPIERIVGGWREFADSVTDHGVPVPPLATRTELARSVGGVRALWLAGEVDRADFAPTGAAGIDPDGIWVSVRELQNSLRSGLSRRDRLRAVISVRSFGRYAKRTAERDGRTKRTLWRAGERTKGPGQ